MSRSYEEQAKDKLAELRNHSLVMHQREEILAHAQVLAMLEVGERIYRLEVSLESALDVLRHSIGNAG